jgi:hypothetical protein
LSHRSREWKLGERRRAGEHRAEAEKLTACVFAHAAKMIRGLPGS